MAAGATYEPIATTTLGSAASSITFNSIPSTYTDLRVVLTCTTASNSVVEIKYNNQSVFYSLTYVDGYGTGTYSGRQTDAGQIRASFNGNTSTTIPTFYTFDIFSYAGSTYKTCLITGQTDWNGSGSVECVVGLWRNTTAISTINLGANTINFNAGTTATLYGIKAA